MPITHKNARRLFGKFVAFNQMLSEQQEVENYYGLSYRMDTWQMWSECDGDHEPNSRTLCCHNGLHMAIKDCERPLGQAEFAVMLGPFDLMVGDDPELLYRQMNNSVKAVLATAQLHIHALGWPCHDECECEQILSEENYQGPNR